MSKVDFEAAAIAIASRMVRVRKNSRAKIEEAKAVLQERMNDDPDTFFSEISTGLGVSHAVIHEQHLKLMETLKMPEAEDIDTFMATIDDPCTWVLNLKSQIDKIATSRVLNAEMATRTPNTILVTEQRCTAAIQLNSYIGQVIEESVIKATEEA